MAEEEVDEAMTAQNTLIEAEHFLASFASLRDENEVLKSQVRALDAQLVSVTEHFNQCQLEKQAIEQMLVAEREKSKESIWSMRGVLQRTQEEKLQWKEKFLNCCLNTCNQPTTVAIPTLAVVQPPAKTTLTTIARASKKSRLCKAVKIETVKQMHSRELSVQLDVADECLVNLDEFHATDQNTAKESGDSYIGTLLVGSDGGESIELHVCQICSVAFSSDFSLAEHRKLCEDRQRTSATATIPHVVGTALSQASAAARVLVPTSSNTVVVSSHTCTLCTFTFCTQEALKQHQGYHTGTHSQMCPDCGRAYASKGGLHKHRQEEHDTNGLVLRCATCEKEFKRAERLRDHIATKHSNVATHHCPFCTASFKLRNYLGNHVRQAHPEKHFRKDVPKTRAKYVSRSAYRDTAHRIDGECRISELGQLEEITARARFDKSGISPIKAGATQFKSETQLGDFASARIDPRPLLPSNFVPVPSNFQVLGQCQIVGVEDGLVAGLETALT